jgi:small-conductance mechanosensitive channel
VRFILDSSRRLECLPPAQAEGGGEGVERNTVTYVIFAVLVIVLVFVLIRFVF